MTRQLFQVTTPGPGFLVRAESAEDVATWAERYLPCPAGAQRERQQLEDPDRLFTRVVRNGRTLTGATIRPQPRCPVVLGREDDGGEHQCAWPAGHDPARRPHSVQLSGVMEL